MSNSKKINLPMMLFLQFAVIIYTLAGVCGRFASNYQFLSLGFILWFGCEFFVLGIYAIVWQQIIKRVDLSVAYVNRSLALCWSMLWAFLIFKESIHFSNIIGVIIIVIGTLIVNSDNG
ncbi:MAG: transporter [Clostridiales bacterium]|nr:transporter [Clostridiales bacterium]